MAKYVDFGKIMVKKDLDGTMSNFIVLGSKNDKKPEYNLTVEIIVRNNQGTVVAHQTDGFVNMYDPRTRHLDLLKKGFIDEAAAQKMADRQEKWPTRDNVRQVLNIKGV